jgi:hypothetical protein
MSKHHYDFLGKGFDYVKAVSRLLGTDFTKLQLDDGVEFIGKKGIRILKLIDDQSKLIVAFDVPVPDLNPDNPIEVIHHHDSNPPKHEWLFTGDTIEEVYTLVEIALRNYKPSETH